MLWPLALLELQFQMVTRVLQARCVAVHACRIMLLPRARKMVMETAEAILTIVLLLLLIAVVLGMPVGKWLKSV